MKTAISILLLLIVTGKAQEEPKKEYLKAKVSYSDYEELVKEVKKHRENRLLNLDDFLKKSIEPKVVILDTRSKKMYDSKHIKGAIHLNFSDFTESNLKALIPHKNTTVLIYCNNNFDGDEINFMSKSIKVVDNSKSKELTLALNIPTYINLYGYGYKNVYELDELVTLFDKRIKYEGTSITNIN